jgi:hypothetical protein
MLNSLISFAQSSRTIRDLDVPPAAQVCLRKVEYVEGKVENVQ